MQPDSLPSYIGTAPPDLPDDLQRAFISADYLINKVDFLTCLFGDGNLADAGGNSSDNAESPLSAVVRGILKLERKLPTAAAAIETVANEITATNRTPVRLALAPDERSIEPNAHQAALSVADCFLETVLDSLQPPLQIFAARNELLPLRRRRKSVQRDCPEIARQLALIGWPDWTALREAILIEAATVAHARLMGSTSGARLAVGVSAPFSAAPARTEEGGGKDGPVPPHWLRWRGQLIRIGTLRARLSWKLLEYFWKRPSATFAELQGPGKPWMDPMPAASLRRCCTR